MAEASSGGCLGSDGMGGLEDMTRELRRFTRFGDADFLGRTLSEVDKEQEGRKLMGSTRFLVQALDDCRAEARKVVAPSKGSSAESFDRPGMDFVISDQQRLSQVEGSILNGNL